MNSTYIIAEAGVNHNGSLEEAIRYIDTAKRIGADAVKFQTFIPDDLVTEQADTASYQKKAHTGGQKSLLASLALHFEDFKVLESKCTEVGIDFLSTPFDLKSADFLNTLNMKAFKIPSGEYENIPLLEKIISFNKPIILSTGLCSLEEISSIVALFESCHYPLEKLSILHCNTDYPTPMEDVHLRAMKAIEQKFNTIVGYSDHTLGTEVAIAAVALGAKVIEKHLTLDKNLPGPDHKMSLEPHEFEQMVQGIRNVEKALGEAKKILTPSAQRNKECVRKSIVAIRDISEGEAFCLENIGVKRPGGGISPLNWHDILGKKAKKDFQIDEFISL